MYHQIYAILPYMFIGPNMSVILRRSVRRGANNVFRERQWLTSFGALFGVFLMLQILLVSLAGAQTMQNVLKSRTNIKLDILPQATNEQRHEFLNKVNELPIIEHAVFITKEQAYESARINDPQLVTFLEKYNMKNPFSDTVGISLRSFEDANEFSDFVQQERWKNVVNPAHLSEITEQEGQANELLSIIATGKTLATLIIIVAAVVLMLVVTELVRQRVAVREEEVFIENLVGADPATVIIPFAVEATFLLWLAASLSLILVIIILFVLPSVSPAFHGDLAKTLSEPYIDYLKGFLPITIAIEILAAPLVAAIGAWLGVRPQLNNGRLKA